VVDNRVLVADPQVGAGGDPHFRAWNGKYYSYHGECDLIMIENPSFQDGLGIELHIRTQINDFYSVISSASIRIGSDILEIDQSNMYYNRQKVTNDQPPSHIAGFPITHITQAKGNVRTEIKLGSDKNAESIVFREKKGFMWIDLKNLSK
jgi:hypothetical protein